MGKGGIVWARAHWLLPPHPPPPKKQELDRTENCTDIADRKAFVVHKTFVFSSNC